MRISEALGAVKMLKRERFKMPLKKSIIMFILVLVTITSLVVPSVLASESENIKHITKEPSWTLLPKLYSEVLPETSFWGLAFVFPERSIGMRVIDPNGNILWDLKYPLDYIILYPTNKSGVFYNVYETAFFGTYTSIDYLKTMPKSPFDPEYEWIIPPEKGNFGMLYVIVNNTIAMKVPMRYYLGNNTPYYYSGLAGIFGGGRYLLLANLSKVSFNDLMNNRTTIQYDIYDIVSGKKIHSFNATIYPRQYYLFPPIYVGYDADIVAYFDRPNRIKAIDPYGHIAWETEIPEISGGFVGISSNNKVVVYTYYSFAIIDENGNPFWVSTPDSFHTLYFSSDLLKLVLYNIHEATGFDLVNNSIFTFKSGIQGLVIDAIVDKNEMYVVVRENIPFEPNIFNYTVIGSSSGKIFDMISTLNKSAYGERYYIDPSIYSFDPKNNVVSIIFSTDKREVVVLRMNTTGIVVEERKIALSPHFYLGTSLMARYNSKYFSYVAWTHSSNSDPRYLIGSCDGGVLVYIDETVPKQEVTYKSPMLLGLYDDYYLIVSRRDPWSRIYVDLVLMKDFNPPEIVFRVNVTEYLSNPPEVHGDAMAIIVPKYEKIVLWNIRGEILVMNFAGEVLDKINVENLGKLVSNAYLDEGLENAYLLLVGDPTSILKISFKDLNYTLINTSLRILRARQGFYHVSHGYVVISNNTIYYLDSKGNLEEELSVHGDIIHVSYYRSPEKLYVATLSKESGVTQAEILDIEFKETAMEVTRYNITGVYLTAFAANPKEDTFILGTWDGRLIFWDGSTKIFEFYNLSKSSPISTPVADIEIADGGKCIIVMDIFGRLYGFDYSYVAHGLSTLQSVILLIAVVGTPLALGYYLKKKLS